MANNSSWFLAHTKILLSRGGGASLSRTSRMLLGSEERLL